jgi:hypothetical protein
VSTYMRFRALHLIRFMMLNPRSQQTLLNSMHRNAQTRNLILDRHTDGHH